MHVARCEPCFKRCSQAWKFIYMYAFRLMAVAKLYHEAKAQAKHLIFFQSCREAGVAFIEFLQQQLGNDPDAVIVLAAHNLKRFDHIFLTREFRRQMGSAWQWPSDWLYFDSLPLAKVMFPFQSNTQVAYASHFCRCLGACNLIYSFHESQISVKLSTSMCLEITQLKLPTEPLTSPIKHEIWRCRTKIECV